MTIYMKEHSLIAQTEVICDYFHKTPEEIGNDELEPWIQQFSAKYRAIWEDQTLWTDEYRTTEKIEEFLYH